MILLVNRIMDRVEQFIHGVNVMMLIDRSVGNTNKGSRRWINKLISTNADEFKDNLGKLLEMQAYINNPDIRLYSSVNPRKLDRAILHFKHKQLDIANDTERDRFYTRLNDKFCSSLMAPENRESNYFLVDVDIDATAVDAVMPILKNGTKIILQYKTPNGWHLICEPFNPTLLADVPHCEVKKDALLLLNTLNQGNH